MAQRKKLIFNELKPDDLKWTCSVKDLEFDSTNKLEPIDGIIGQERAVKALKLGVSLRSPGYNIFITGLSGTGKFSTIKKMLEEIRPDCPKLSDYLYVNNFADPNCPTLLVLPAGKGKKFKNDLAATIIYLKQQIPKELDNKSFINKKKHLVGDYSKRQQTLMGNFEEKLKKEHFTLGQIKNGEYQRPEILIVIKNKPVFVQQIEEFIQNKTLTKLRAKEIIKKYNEYSQELSSIIRNSIELNQKYQEAIVQLENETVSFIIKTAIAGLKEKYKDKKLRTYMDSVEANIFENLISFKESAVIKTGDDELQADDLSEYEVNLILDNSTVKECPVIIETSPTHGNLFGSIEKYSDGQGGWHADFSKIKAGSLLKANGGYLVINARDTYEEPGVWTALKRALLYNKLEIQDISTLYYFTPSVLKPEPIEIDTKIILIGNNNSYSLLASYEDDFNKIFKVKAEFDYEMKRTAKAIVEYAQFIKKLVEKETLLDFDKTAIARIIEYGARYAGEKNKLTTRFAYIADLVRESSFCAHDVGSDIVGSYFVDEAYKNSRERHALSETKMSELFDDGTYLIDISGERIGQVNGLAVYDTGQHSFGKPARITATVALGNGSIINVERESGLSGSIHNKAILIIGGFFREIFGQKIPLSFTASIVFEQGYGPIDGDSASIAEICVLLSCLAGVPIKQHFAVTGSINQKGDVQPIGGVNEKIEGYFDVCKKYGFNKKHGVLIPVQNVKDLMLKDEIVKAVKDGDFHIYPVTRIEDATAILMDKPAGTLLKNGSYEPTSIFGLVEKNLLLMREKVKPESSVKKNNKKSDNKSVKKK